MQDERNKSDNALNLNWVFGFNRNANGGVHNLSTDDKQILFYTSAHIGIIYDVFSGTQKHLLGHVHQIKCCKVNTNRTVLVTADQGSDPVIIFWDALRGTPIKSINAPHSNGVEDMDFSSDGTVLATLSHVKGKGEKQQISLWDWNGASSEPLASSMIESDTHNCIRFNPNHPDELMSSGYNSVLFWVIGPQLGLTSINPMYKTERNFSGQILRSTYFGERFEVLSSTSEGELILWDVKKMAQDILPVERELVKVVKLHDSAINVVQQIDVFIVTGGSDGFVRFFDAQFRLVAWYEDIKAGPISSISFSNRLNVPIYEDTVVTAPQFIISTKNGNVIQMDPVSFDDIDSYKREGTTLLQAQDGPVSGLDVHPTRGCVAIGGQTGLLQLWDYVSRKLRTFRRFEKQMISTLKFDPRGKILAVAFSSGVLKLVSARSLKDLSKCSWRNSKESVTHVVFSADAMYMATADADYCVALYQRIVKKIVSESPSQNQDEDSEEWQYIGKFRSHWKNIIGLAFRQDAYGPQLISIGEDKMLVEYDISNCSIVGGLVLKGEFKMEQNACPTAFAWHPSLPYNEDFLVTANDQYKFKLSNGNTKVCKKTILAPTYGSPVNNLLPLGEKTGYMAYSTQKKVIGLVKFPLDGNPNKTMGLIAHPNQITAIGATSDSKYLFSAGGSDCSVHQWETNFDVINEKEVTGGTGMEPFMHLIEGQKEGKFWQELKEYFYFAQIRSQGENSISSHHIGNQISVFEIPNVMRALGFYPTEKEANDLINEVRFGSYNSKGIETDLVGFEQLVLLYVNHRPFFNTDKERVEEAFAQLGLNQNGKISFARLCKLLQQHGEKISEFELQDYFDALLSADQQNHFLKSGFTSQEFSEELLGLGEIQVNT